MTIALAAVLLGGCGQPVPTPASEVRAPEFAPPAAKRESASPVTPPAPAEQRAQGAPPDFKDSAGSLDRAR